MVEIGDAVVYVDPAGYEHEALITAIHGGGEKPSLNLVFVVVDENSEDQYGRQINRATSVPERENQAANGNFWHY